VERWKHRDPIAGLTSLLERAGAATADAVAHFESQIAAEIDDAIAFADAGGLEPVEDLTRFVYAEEQARGAR
jgi:TPP-dependent pyruvate/acetoin dehydrogenase alpha subunit